MKYSPIILLAVLTLAAPGTAQEQIPEVERAYGLAFYEPGWPGSVKADVCLRKAEDTQYGHISILFEGDDVPLLGEWFSPIPDGRTWFVVLGPASVVGSDSAGMWLTGSWENFSSAVVAGQWAEHGPDLDTYPAYGSVKGQQLNFNNTCN